MKPVVVFFLRLIGYLPLSIHYFNSVWIAFIIEHIVRYRTRLVDKNLEHSFPEKSVKERKKIRHEFYRHFTRIFLEAIWFGSCRNPERLRRSKIAKMVNPEYLNELFEQSPSIMLMCAHTGNWELFGGVTNYSPDVPLKMTMDNFVVVYRRLKNVMFDEIMKENRKAPITTEFDGIVESKNILRYVLKHREGKKLYAFITDQKPYFPNEGNLKVNFMNKECTSMTASAGLANKFDMACVYVRMREERWGRYTIEFVPIAEKASTMDPDDMIRRYYELLEEDLKAQPYNYLWSHNRWRESF